VIRARFIVEASLSVRFMGSDALGILEDCQVGKS
jgi:hypothetical protein